ncbi:endonuclease/exonuclease/phosphatase family protein [Streptococcus macacae]|uniref:Endonuclease/exonuclease/phosphatase family protein n=1 Tax=Streptococcus macacae NCTC 11558 TaxID=764298 RepID=G5JWW6_9STRE|nr:endonuclease/exonuclease/phosphatase family protein [Streptococcus macacae]EHJ52638.1 endonuclease/exonuclease/phosphatase family protein [Streptococcus macacae NCTC 11558]SUN79442.1 endonuclease/exonuclease/phosphatase family protein [Streptococcus macacae NCTC 11558]
MVALLTINSHSWMEAEPQRNLEILGKTILANDYDIICVQEVNQLLHSKAAKDLPNYCQAAGTPAIHEDNYALKLVTFLLENGKTYYWSWAYNHIGYDRFQEGVAILSKQPLISEGLLISEADDEHDYHTRRVLLGKTKLDHTEITVASLHMSWWDKGFQGEWAKLEKALLRVETPIILMGDFNNPYDKEGYQLILNSRLQLQDSHQTAVTSYGEATIQAEIDGWQGNQQALKVDYIFMSQDFQAEKSEVIFDGENYPVISDHFGLACQADLRNNER